MDVEDDDGALAERIAACGDHAAEAALCRRWSPRIRAYGRLHLGNDAAADLAQEVLVVVLRALRERRVTEPHRLGAYISGVCRNMSRDWKRGEQRRNAFADASAAAAAEIATPAPVVERSRLVDCLRKLGARDRAIVVLTYYADQDSDEIAGTLAMSSGNVRVARHRALKQLLYCVGGDP